MSERSVASPLLEVEDLHVHFRSKRTKRTVRAVDGVSLAIARGETVGLVGESGCGKTTLSRAILGVVRPTSGSVKLRGTEMFGLSRRQWRPHRPLIQAVFQDPFSSLDPRMTVHDLVAEPLRINRRYDRSRVDELLDSVGLSPQMGTRYPASFSGGQRQRIGIARALALDPEILILDEPVSALDVSIQAQVMNLLKRLQKDLGLTYLFISHDLAVVRHMSSTVAVMYLGRIVEYGTRDQIFSDPQHPYTQSLLDAIPVPLPDASHGLFDRPLLAGDVPDPADAPLGCNFSPRCPRAQTRCTESDPPADQSSVSSTHQAACYFPGPADLAPAAAGRQETGDASP